MRIVTYPSRLSRRRKQCHKFSRYLPSRAVAPITAPVRLSRAPSLRVLLQRGNDLRR